MKLESLCKAYGPLPVLENFSLELPETGTICLFGPSGCGKTTLLHCIAGLQQLDSGSITGCPAKISYIFQEDRLLPWETAKDNIAAVLPSGKESLAQVWLERAGLPQAAEKFPEELSGGMRQRVALARALAYEGMLYLLDEPFHALDFHAKQNMMQFVREYTRTALKIFVTHDREEAQHFSDWVYVLDGPPLQVKHVFTAVEFGENERLNVL